MRVLSLWQPWASAIALGLKTIETRHWKTSYRGPLAIHAAKRWTADERAFSEAAARHYAQPELLDPPRGVIIAVAQLVDIEPTENLIGWISQTEQSFGNYAPNRFGWLLQDIKTLNKPVPMRGAQGLINLPADLKEIIAAAIP